MPGPIMGHQRIDDEQVHHEDDMDARPIMGRQRIDDDAVHHEDDTDARPENESAR